MQANESTFNQLSFHSITVESGVIFYISFTLYCQLFVIFTQFCLVKCISTGFLQDVCLRPFSVHTDQQEFNCVPGSGGAEEAVALFFSFLSLQA